MITKSPFLSRYKQSILSKYCFKLNDRLYSIVASVAIVPAGIPPSLLKLGGLERIEISWYPLRILVVSTFALKSNTSFRETFPYTTELKSGTSSSVTPASCRYESTVQKSPWECSK